MNRLRAIILFVVGWTGCGQPCSDPTRINGEWIAHTTMETPTTGSNIEAHPLCDAPILSKTMPWSATFFGSSREVELDIGPDTHQANYIVDDEDCDAFSIEIESFFEVKELDEGGRLIGGTHHEFIYQAKLRYTGPRITGTFLYQDEWVGLIEEDQIGSISVPEAQLTISPVN